MTTTHWRQHRAVVRAVTFSLCLFLSCGVHTSGVMETGRAYAQLPAFPGAEGAGQYSTGGRGGDVYHVTSLANSGSGSLRYGIDSARGPRTIVFDVSGTIALTSKLRIDHPNITIAGQTAPGQGIVISNFGASVDANNAIIQHLRFRPGDAYKGLRPLQYDFAVAVTGQNVILDHISASWSISQVVTINGTQFNNVTIQNSIIGEALDQTGIYHNEWNDDYLPGGPSHHANGLFVKPLSGGSGTYVASAHHNLLINNHSRNPAPGVRDETQSVMFDFRNNVVYNNRNSGYNSGTDGGSITMNYVGNYVIAGPNTQSGSRVFEGRPGAELDIYQSGNLVDSDRDQDRDGINREWSAFQGTYKRLSDPSPMPTVTTESAEAAYDRVLAQSGAFWWDRDSVDERLVLDVINNTGRIINSQSEVGGYPVIQVVHRPAEWDTDADGMPDWWEEANDNLNPLVADNNGDWNGNGYTNLEEFLHALARGPNLPEPSAGLLAAIGACAFCIRRRRRASQWRDPHVTSESRIRVEC
ncbi:MAG: hypothetical protein R3C10_28145 [Pirellulales bacterium]